MLWLVRICLNTQGWFRTNTRFEAAK